MLILAALIAFGDLHYRWVGPAVMGGRLDAVAGVPGNPRIVYLGHSSGGLWKSQNGGLTFSSAFDAGASSAVGAIAIDPRDPNRIYIGTGEPFPRNTADAGDGIWMSPDGAKHWTHLGLAHSASIARIAIDPAKPRTILVAVIGDEFAASAQRGIYRSTDAGAHWKRVLFVNGTTGGSDLAFDPKNPNVVYAGMYDFRRRPWTFRSGGPGSGLYKSVDAGKTWRRLTDPRLHDGLPGGPIDRVGVSVCASDPRVVYALIPTRRGLLYRSTDGGTHWQLRSADRSIDFRPFYFSQVRCDPRNPRKVYSLGGAIMLSTDGGKSFKDAGGGGDNHDLWIDPGDPARLLNASDMGFAYSLDGAQTWVSDNVVPFAQVYRVGYDFAHPYHIMGGLQDHEVWWGPNELFNRNDGPSNGDWLNIADWGDGQYAMADPRNPAIVYEDTHFGDLARVNIRTGQRRYIGPEPMIRFGTGAGAYRYRFNWSAPLLISHFDPNVIYFGGNVLFRSPDGGNSWAEFSPDLTKCDPAQLRASGGPVTLDDTNAETYCTIYTIGEDAVDPRTLWYGTDNGHLEITRDFGRTWSDLISHVPGLPLPALVSCIEPSPTRSGTAYAAFDRHEWNDNRPYLYVTHDFGQRWRPIDAGLSGYVHVVREDPRNPAVLYAGTQRGIQVSFDDGKQWSDLRLGLPHLPIDDLQIQPRDNDLIVGSHGRGFYILDDLTPLEQWSTLAGRPALLFRPMPAMRYNTAPYHEHPLGAFVSANKPYGVLLSLYLAHAPKPGTPKAKPTVRVSVYSGAKRIDLFNVPVHAGLNRFTWNLRTQAPGPFQDKRPYYVFYSMKVTGPQVLAGKYTIAVDTPWGRFNVPATVQMDPHEHASVAALQAQYDALLRIAAVQERAEATIAQLRRMRRDATGRSAVERLLNRLRNPDRSGYRRPAELTEQLGYLRHTIAQYDGWPTAAQESLIVRYTQEMETIRADMATMSARNHTH